jgi:nucleoside-diphosphate-sugar epimerase
MESVQHFADSTNAQRKTAPIAKCAGPIEGNSVFLTGASGYIGMPLVRAALAQGYAVYALARSQGSAAELAALGAMPVLGDLTERQGEWRSAVCAADAVIHLAQPLTFGGRVTSARAEHYRDLRLAMDCNLLDALANGHPRKIIYVSGTSYYGNCGKELVGEEAAPHPMGWGPYLAPATEALEDYIERGLPIVSAFPGWVYGPGSWFAEYVLAPLYAGKALTAIKGPSRVTSPIHVDDCASALLHLVASGTEGERYFLVDDEPTVGECIVRLAAQTLGVPFRVRRMPRLVFRLLLGRVITESLEYENALSDAKLRATGFVPAFPTYREGIPNVVDTWLRSANRK